MATGTPTGVMVNMPITGIEGSVLCASTSKACTTRFVLVPISVQIAAEDRHVRAAGMNSFDGLIPVFLHQSLSAGMNIATTGVLLRKALDTTPAASGAVARSPPTSGSPAGVR